MEFAGSLGRDLLPSGSDELQTGVKNPKVVRPAQLEFSQIKNDKNQLQITTPDIAYHADLIDAEVKQLQSRQFWMLNEALDVKDLNKKLGSEVAGCTELCETLKKDLSDDKARVELLNESMCKLHETRSKLEAALSEAKSKVQKKQQQLNELERSEAKLAEEINSKDLHDAQAELQKHQLQVPTVVEISFNAKKQTESLISQLRHLESELQAENEARDEMLGQISAFKEKRAALQQQCQEEREEIKALIRSASDTKKIVVEKQALLRELELALLSLRADVKQAADKRETRGVELDSLMEDLKVSENEFSRMERTMEEIQNNAKVFESTVFNRLEKKNDLVNAKETLDMEKVMLEKQVSEMRKMSTRKVEERKQLKTRVQDLIQSCNKFNKEDEECQRQIKELSRREASGKVSKHQLQSDLKRTSCEVEKLRENVNNLVKDKDFMESRYRQWQKDNLKLSEQELAAKNELAIALEKLASTQRALNKTKIKLGIDSVAKERLYGDHKINAIASGCQPTAQVKKKGFFRKSAKM